MTLLRLAFAIATLCTVAGVALTGTAQQADRATDLAQEPGWQLVQANCTACHTTQLITQNSGDRAVWLSRIRWMQDTQGLPTLADEVESSILDYLAANYGPKPHSRRSGLPPELMPPNPYDN